MIMKKCHKCGDVYEPFNKDGLTYSIEGLIFTKINGENRCFEHEAYNLCVSCSDKLLKWLDEGADDGGRKNELKPTGLLSLISEIIKLKHLNPGK